VFRYFCENYEELKEVITDVETNRLKNLIIGTVLKKWDPKTIEVTIQNKDSKAGIRSHSITSWAPIFGDALRTASLLGLQDEIQEYREEIINYIPFAYYQEEQAIKDIVFKAEEEELQYVNSVFLDQDKDIRYYLPSTYTYIVPQLLEETSDSSSKQVYLSFIEDENIEGYVRVQAIEKLESCLDKDDEEYLIELFDKYLSSEDEKEVEIAERANELLISHFANEEAIKWRFDQIKERAKPFKEPDDVHEVSSFEEELHSMRFASVLSQNLDSQYLDKITDLLIHSFELSDNHRSYINYLWRIVISYFKKIAREGSFAPYNHLVQILKDYSTTKTNTSNWFSSRLEEIRNYYIDTIGKVNLETFKEFEDGTRKN
jgi:hypothetical protein